MAWRLLVFLLVLVPFAGCTGLSVGFYQRMRFSDINAKLKQVELENYLRRRREERLLNGW